LVEYFGWKFMGKFAHGLGSANTLQVVEAETHKSFFTFETPLLIVTFTSY
jgi:hypothetical protein